MTKQIKLDQFYNENIELFQEGFLKLNLLPTILLELKKNNRKWLVQCDGDNIYPDTEANQIHQNYDNWNFTDDIENSINEIKNYGDCHILLDNSVSWFRWIACNGDGVDALCDYTTTEDLKFLNEMTERDEFQ